MIVIGSIWPELKFSTVFTDKELYLFSFLKLLVLPMITFFRPEILYQRPYIIGDLHDPLRLPIAGNVSMLCMEYNRDVTLVSKGICISTLPVHDLDPDRVGVGCDLIISLPPGHPTIGWKSCGRLKTLFLQKKGHLNQKYPRISRSDVLLFFLCILFLYLHASWTYMGGEYHLGTGLAELLELAEEAIELHCVSKATFMITEYSPVTLLHSKMFGIPSA